MKKKILFILTLLLFLPINTLALQAGYWSASSGYNYDVDTLYLDGSNNIILAGWAVLDASPKTSGGSPDTSLMSGVKSTTLKRINSTSSSNLPYDCSKTNTYSFSLKVYSAKNGKKVSLLKTYKSSDADTVSMTYALSHKHGAYIKYSYSSDTNYACYENVGFKFKIDKASLSGATELIFRLVVDPAGSSSKEFDITVITITGGSDSSRNINYDLISTSTRVSKVTNLMQNGYTWGKPGYSNNTTKSSSYAINNGNVLTVVDSERVDNMIWYGVKVKGKKRWIPSSWVLPNGNATVVLSDAAEPETCISNVVVPSKTSATLKTCDGTDEQKTQSYKECTTASNNYYTIKCEETITSTFDSDIPTQLYAGQGFKLEVTVTSSRTCKGTFKKEEFLENWNIAKTNYDAAEEGSAAQYEALGVMNNLISVIETYNDYSEVDYDFEPDLEGTISYKVKSGSINENIGFDLIIDNGNSIYTNTNEVKLEIEGVSNPIDFTYSNASSPKNASYITSHTYLTPIIGTMNGESKDGESVDGYNYYYISHDAVAGSFRIKLTLSNLGEFKTHTVTNEKCSGNISTTNLIYRHIDLSDPFVTSASSYTHTIGKNWSSSTNDFTEEASQTGSVLYSFTLTPSDLKEIKKFQATQKENLYIGGCTDSDNGADTDPVCELLNKGKR